MKKLITANDIRDAHAAGQTRLEVVLKASIITPEAYVVAEQLGFVICEASEASPGSPAEAPVSSAERQKIRECILARLPEGSVTESLIAQLVDKVVQEQEARAQKPADAAPGAQSPSSCGAWM